MPKIEFTSTIRAPRSLVFAQLANSENLPKMVSAYKTVRVKGKEGDWEICEAEAEAFGAKMRGILKRRFHPDDKIEEVIESNMATGTNTITLVEAPEGTTVHYLADIRLKGSLAKILGPLASRRLKKSFEEDAMKTRNFIEGAR